METECKRTLKWRRDSVSRHGSTRVGGEGEECIAAKCVCAGGVSVSVQYGDGCDTAE